MAVEKDDSKKNNNKEGFNGFYFEPIKEKSNQLVEGAVYVVVFTKEILTGVNTAVATPMLDGSPQMDQSTIFVGVKAEKLRILLEGGML